VAVTTVRRFFFTTFMLSLVFHEDGGLHEVALVAFARTACGGFGAFLMPDSEDAADAIELLFGNERAGSLSGSSPGRKRIFEAAWEMRRRLVRKFSFRRRGAEPAQQALA